MAAGLLCLSGGWLDPGLGSLGGVGRVDGHQFKACPVSHGLESVLELSRGEARDQMAELFPMSKALAALAVGKVEVLEVDSSGLVGSAEGQELADSPAQMAVPLPG